VPAQHHALDWLARRHAGESAALIAWRAGVRASTVLTATKPYGPFPRPCHQLGRTTVSDEHHRQRVQAWIEQRRRGRTATEIAHEYGVSHQIVSRATLGHGPFPSDDTVAAWVTARRQRHNLREISQPGTAQAHRPPHRCVRAVPCTGGYATPPGRAPGHRRDRRPCRAGITGCPALACGRSPTPARLRHRPRASTVVGDHHRPVAPGDRPADVPSLRRPHPVRGQARQGPAPGIDQLTFTTAGQVPHDRPLRLSSPSHTWDGCGPSHPATPPRHSVTERISGLSKITA